MPEKHHVAIDRARKAAKLLSREGGVTHQQALDRIARDAGFRHWNEMASATPAADPVPLLLLEGPVASPPPSRGPSRPFFEMDEMRHLLASEVPQPREAPTLRDVEHKAGAVSAAAPRRAGLKLNDWISDIMREAASKVLPRGAATYGHRIRQLPFDARMAAEALDPNGAPHEGQDLLVRCPLHDDSSPSLRITGSGETLRVSCMAGCLATDVRDRLISRLGEECAAALAFMRGNDRSKVIGGSAHGAPGVGGAGGTYVLADGSSHSLGILACRMLTDGYPDWFDGRVPRSVAALERRLRIALAGNLAIKVEAPEDRAKGLWRFTVLVGHDRGYRILLSMRQGEQAGVNAAHEGRFSVNAAETFARPEQAVARVVELTRSFETLDPAERTAIQIRHVREVARDERLRGTVKGWGWWAGPNPDEMTYGGPYKTRAEAVSHGNGHCDERGDHFYVVQARTVDDGHDEDGMVTFAETRSLKRCRAT